MHPSLKNVTERAQKCDFSVNIHILIELITGFMDPTFCVRKLTLTRHCVFPLNIALKKIIPTLEMHPSLKNVTERAQKCDFSVNFHILIEQTGFRSDILCQKDDITCHCVFPLNIALKETFQL